MVLKTSSTPCNFPAAPTEMVLKLQCALESLECLSEPIASFQVSDSIGQGRGPNVHF